MICYDFSTLYAAYRAGLLTWDGIRASQTPDYAPCANGCERAGAWRTLDDRYVCEPCYMAIAADERRRVYE